MFLLFTSGLSFSAPFLHSSFYTLTVFIYGLKTTSFVLPSPPFRLSHEYWLGVSMFRSPLLFKVLFDMGAYVGMKDTERWDMGAVM